ncbi:PKD domain-containing protein [Candidatus Entotheonella palauensis]|uniref:PKD domain-containing protein n=1 Tax=Candidatus Entotheonella palauensis TaxID=93172 RepID=UPI000B7D0109|nr:PKD domain-containing protein [Candidatus Entotheonella palauensis]
MIYVKICLILVWMLCLATCSNEGSDSGRQTNTVTLANTAPIAHAGPDQRVMRGDTVTLDGTASSDVDGDRLSFVWTFIAVPLDSVAVLSDATAVKLIFAADAEGEYVLELHVSDATHESESDTVTVTTAPGNTAPLAHAGLDQSAKVGDTVVLDGSGSSDADGDPLVFEWSLTSTPSGSLAALNDPTRLDPTFVIDQPGDYAAQLIVHDGTAQSLPGTVVITTGNARPVADAGPDQHVTAGERVRLNGGTSSDANGDRLHYQWSLISQPEGSTASLTAPDRVSPELIADEIGYYVVQLIVHDGGLISAPNTVTMTAEPGEPLAIVDLLPNDGTLTQQPAFVFSGHLNHKARLSVNGTSVPMADDLSFNLSVTLNQGPNVYTFTATNALGETVTEVRTVTLSTAPQLAPNAGLIAIGEPRDGTAAIDAQSGSVPPNTHVTITNTRTGESVRITADASGAFSAVLTGRTGDTFSIVYHDSAGQRSSPAHLTAGNLPPDPALVAPPLDITVTPNLFDATAFLYRGPQAIRTGMAPDTLDRKRAAVVRGRVRDADGRPLAGVTITILHHPEFGRTLSCRGGGFDLAVNGGGQLVADYRLEGFLPVQRHVHPRWQSFATVDDVVMIPLDPQAARIDLSANRPMQAARGRTMNDADGSRQATILFPQGTTATMTLPDGSSAPLTTLAVRATEYTAGSSGPQQMPGPLPPASGYTYAVELSVDEALAAGASRVDFSQPLPLYVDNFLNFPVGEPVPTGFYDRHQAVRMASDNGRIIAILALDAQGLAQLDLDGSGQPADRQSLADLGVTDAERQQLARLYPPGKRLWRVPISHFTPWDCNWPFGPPPDAVAPPPPPPPNDPPPDEDSNACQGCVINPQAQTLGETLPLVGVPFSLHYQSQRMPGYRRHRTVDIPLSGAHVPVSLQGIELTN